MSILQKATALKSDESKKSLKIPKEVIRRNY